MTAIDIDDTRTQIIARIPAPDETGGLDLFVDMLWSKKDATGEYQIIEHKTEADAHTVMQTAQSKSPGRLRRALGRAKAAILKAVATVREATQWLFHDVPNPHLIQRFRNRFFGYKGKHHTAAAWYGRQRSTSAAVVITRERRMRAQQTSRTKEGVLSSYFPLPEYWVSHMVGLIETIREEHSIFHPSTGRHWECS